MKNKIICTLMGVFLFLMSSTACFAADADRIVIPDGYINQNSKITVETTEDSSKELISIRVKTDHSAYADITDTKSFSVDKNCTAYVKIRYKDKDGKEETIELEKDIRNFDGTVPKVAAFIKGEDLNIQISDDASGVKLLNVDGIEYTDLNDGMIGINLKELESTSEYFTIYAVDNAGNRTNTLRVYNPYYVGEDPSSTTDRGVDNPQSTDETKPTSATGLITSHTDEDGDDMMGVNYREWKEGYGDSNAMGSKQFFTIKTKSDKTFYIVVDESYNQQTAYLLTEASENDLLNFVNYDGNSVDTGETTVYTIPTSDKKDVTVTETANEVSEQPKEKNKSSIGIILIVAVAAGGAYYYKMKKNKDQNDADEYSQEEEFEQSEEGEKN